MGKISEFITWQLVSSELRSQSFATPTVFVQFSYSLTFWSSKGWYTLLHLLNLSGFTPYGFTDYLQNDSCDWRLWHINYIYVVLPNVQSKLAKLYLYDFSLVWVLWWIRRPEIWLKALSHMLHLKGFSPVLFLWWLPRFAFWVKHQPQISHLYGFSPVWILWWTVRCAFWLKALPHISHLYGFSPIWILQWTIR